MISDVRLWLKILLQIDTVEIIAYYLALSNIYKSSIKILNNYSMPFILNYSASANCDLSDFYFFSEIVDLILIPCS